jgi:hypothetical protein
LIVVPSLFHHLFFAAAHSFLEVAIAFFQYLYLSDERLLTTARVLAKLPDLGLQTFNLIFKES